MSISGTQKEIQELAPVKSKGKKFGFIDLQDTQHFLRLRKRLALSDKAALELGADINVHDWSRRFNAGILYDIHANGSKFATLRATQHSLSLRKSFPCDLKQLSFTFHAILSIGTKGPELGFDFDDIKPLGLVAAGALGALAAGKSISGTRAFSATRLHKPEWLYDDIHFKFETKAVVKREGARPIVGIRELNGLVYF
eukprot:jgi/Botrbrau1/9548/Bobra.0089s0008.2